MSPQDALNLIDSVLAQVVLNRVDHEKLRSAVNVLANAISQPTPQKEA